MRRPHAMTVGLVALGMMVSGCYGPFYLTRKVWKFNGEISDNKWIVEVAYLLMSYPIYGLAGTADALIFNAIEFWTGNNPLAESASTETRRIVRKDGEFLLKRDAGDLIIEQMRDGQSLSSVRLRRMGDHMAALNSDGAVLFNARTEADGRVVITDGSGKQMASYSGDQAEQMLRAVERF